MISCELIEHLHIGIEDFSRIRQVKDLSKRSRGLSGRALSAGTGSSKDFRGEGFLFDPFRSDIPH
jgi:hypothetical protein